MFLANYYGDKTYLSDTAFQKSKGNFIFEANKELPGGLYIVVSQDKKSLFEFLVSDSRDIKFDTKGPDYVANMKISNSFENNLFYDYLQFSGALYDDVKPLNDQLKNLPQESDSTVILKDKIDQIDINLHLNMEMI